MKIGLLGGSFDPVHLAHIKLANVALDALHLDEVQLIPAANPWQRPPLMASPEHRLAMLEIARRHDPLLKINPIEIHRGGPTYTADTLEALPQGPDYYWILGADQLANFCSWDRWRDIVALVRLAVADRPGTPAKEPHALREQLDTLDTPLIHLPPLDMNVSSTLIRQQLALGEPTDGMLDVAVTQYIHENHLYQPPGP